jgi:hypothetical protein
MGYSDGRAGQEAGADPPPAGRPPPEQRGPDEQEGAEHDRRRRTDDHPDEDERGETASTVSNVGRRNTHATRRVSASPTTS